MIKEALINTPMMLALTIGAYVLGVFVRKRSGLGWLHPLLICLPVIISTLIIFNIPVETYNEGNRIIYFLLGPCVVSLGLKMYDSRKMIRENLLPISAAVVTGSIVGVFGVWALGRLFGLPGDMVTAMEPKSVTVPIAMDIVESLGGNTALIATSVVLTGFTGAFLGPIILDLVKIKNPISRGAGFGCAAHGVGTAKALEEGALEGAVSGLCIALMGVLTAVIVPLFNL